MYVSRKDFQVKINGYRVELGEIENVYAEAAKNKYAIVLPFQNAQDNTELAIIIEGKEYDYTDHQAYMSTKLTKYMMPSKWLFVKSMPLNQNGKVDRNKIRQLFNLYVLWTPKLSMTSNACLSKS
jgi:acyl-coenzyme A synthetase/AMP-(fatty) acid ligase